MMTNHGCLQVALEDWLGDFYKWDGDVKVRSLPLGLGYKEGEPSLVRTACRWDCWVGRPARGRLLHPSMPCMRVM